MSEFGNYTVSELEELFDETFPNLEPLQDGDDDFSEFEIELLIEVCASDCRQSVFANYILDSRHVHPL